MTFTGFSFCSLTDENILTKSQLLDAEISIYVDARSGTLVRSHLAMWRILKKGASRIHFQFHLRQLQCFIMQGCTGLKAQEACMTVRTVGSTSSCGKQAIVLR